MNVEFIEHLPIRDVSQEQTNSYTISISFFLQDAHYSLILKEREGGTFRPWIVSHDRSSCPYCDERYHCELEQKGSLLFQRLIQMPSIRLEWLFIKHDETPESAL